MTKEKYMSELETKLDVFGEDIKNEIVSDYEEHFRMGLAGGKTEDQICRELGSIDELVSELNKLTGKQDDGKSAGSKRTGFEFNIDDETKEKFSKAAENLGENVSDAMKSFAGFLGTLAANVVNTSQKVGGNAFESAGEFAGKASEKAGEFAGKAGEKASEFADKASVKAEEFAKSFMAGFETATESIADKATKFAKEVSQSYNTARNKDAAQAAQTAQAFGEEKTEAGESEAVNVQEGCSSEECDSVIISADCADIIISESEDETVRFNYTNHGTVNQQLAYKFDFHQEGKTIYASVKKRPGTTNFFKSMSCPSIELEVFIPEGLKNVAISTMSGEIKAEDVSVEQVDMKTMSGDIDIDNCVFKALEATTLSGDINTEDCTSVSASFSTVSGDLNFEGNSESINAKTTSGDLNISGSNVADINANSISGDVEVELEGVDGYLAHVKTTCGDISLDFGNESLDIIRGGSYVMGSGEVKINASTVSGDISIEA